MLRVRLFFFKSNNCLHIFPQNTPLLRALADSLVHGLVGGITWAVVEGPDIWRGGSKPFLRCIAATILASAVDVDHFLAARSLNLQVTRYCVFNNCIFHFHTANMDTNNKGNNKQQEK